MDPKLPFEKLKFNPFAKRNNLLLNNLKGKFHDHLFRRKEQNLRVE